MNRELDTAVGATLRSMRRSSGYSQQTVADLLGVKQPTVARWESGTASPPTELMVNATVLYGSTPAQLYSAPAVQEASEGVVRDQVRDRAQRLADEINQRQNR